MPFLFTNRDFAQRLRYDLQRHPDSSLGKRLAVKCEECMREGPWSVVSVPSKAASGDPHDFYSEAPYWWPDPQNPSGPFVRRDGQSNPHAARRHNDDLKKLASAVLYLSYGGYFLGGRACSDRAAELLRIWFVRGDTRMSPHMEYAQAIPGVCSGRGIGIIDAIPLIKIVHAAGYLEALPGYGKDVGALREWIARFLGWLTASQKGMDEKNNGNNHSTWWNSQAACYSIFCGEQALARECFDFFKSAVVSIQMAADGSFPLELARTRSLHYSLFNLDACAVLCELASSLGIDLWHDALPDGRGMRLAVDFLSPFLENPALWPFQEIGPAGTEDCYALHCAAYRFAESRLARINRDNIGNKEILRDTSPIGSLEFLPGLN